MELSIKLVLDVLFIYNILFSNLAIAQNEPKCSVRIYETGLYLEWRSALLEYTQYHKLLSPFDQTIYKQLEGTHNSVEGAAFACMPTIPAWQG